MSPQPTKTDNKSIANKIFIRKEAIKNLKEARVLDLFAGRNVLWNNIKTDKYFGIDIATNKGKNLNADTRQVFDSIDLSEFNVIDCDSYGIAFDLYKKILTNPNIKKGTIIIYTLITNEFTKIQNEAKKEFNFKHFYDKAPSLFNARAIEFYYEMLAYYGIKEVNYYAIRDKFDKHYGYFIIN
ncbi:MAG: hypothetical protein ACI4L6_02630 [Candidatus Onthoplasma sp.]